MFEKMNRITVVAAVFVICAGRAEAGRLFNLCQPKSTCCTPAVQWYKAKDGTLREKLPYWTALSRAEDADDLEIKLHAVEDELTAAQTELQETRSAAASVQAMLEQQIAELRNQLEAEKQSVAAQKARAEKAESEQKSAVAQLAEVKSSSEQLQARLASVQNDLKAAAEERDKLKSSNESLQKQVSELTTAKENAEKSLREAQEQLNRVKQDAAETKKPEVQEARNQEPKPE